MSIFFHFPHQRHDFKLFLLCAIRHRILAELLEQGTRTTLVIPTHLPVVSSSTLSSLAQSSPGFNANSSQRIAGMVQTGELESLRSLGLNPSHALQHPGFYYYMSARCTEMRRERFMIALDAEVICTFIVLLFFHLTCPGLSPIDVSIARICQREKS